MSLVKAGFAAIVGTLLWMSPGTAQPRAIVLSAREGGFHPTAALNTAGTADLKGITLSAGGGLAVELFRNLGLRGSFTFARSEYRLAGTGSGIHLNRWFYDGAVQYRLPKLGNVQPHVYGGAGVVVLDQPSASGDDQTKFAATAGLVLGYQIPDTPVGFFAECRGWRYRLSGLGTPFNSYDRIQYDVNWSGGLSFRLWR